MAHELERRPGTLFTASGANERLRAAAREATSRLGGACDVCRIGPPIRKACVVTAGIALCRDCADARRLDRIHTRIHRR